MLNCTFLDKNLIMWSGFNWLKMSTGGEYSHEPSDSMKFVKLLDKLERLQFFKTNHG